MRETKGPISMYGELLLASLEIQGDRDLGSDPAELQARVLELRARLSDPGTMQPTAAGVADDIASNIDYDLALTRLCTAYGIDVDPKRFERPMIERRRLENSLRAFGVDLERS